MPKMFSPTKMFLKHCFCQWNHQKTDLKKSAILSKDVVEATGKIKHSKSTSNLREKHSTLKPLALPLSSALLLSGAYPGYRPPDSEIIPFVDDSIPYLVNDPPMSLTNVNSNDYQSCPDTSAKCSLFETESIGHRVKCSSLS